MRGGIHRNVKPKPFPAILRLGRKKHAVHRIMNFLSMVAPSPDDMPAPINSEGEEVKPDANGPTSLFFFKTTVEPHIGEVSYFKVMSGTIKGR